MSPALLRTLAAARLQPGERVALLGPASRALAAAAAGRVGGPDLVEPCDLAPARPAPAGRADVVLAVLASCAPAALAPALQEARRLLAPGGRLGLCVPDPARGGASAVREALLAAGFEGVEHERIVALSPVPGGARPEQLLVARARRSRSGAGGTSRAGARRVS